MGNVLKITVYVAALLLVSLWVASVAKSCNSSDNLATTDQTSVDGTQESDEFEDDFFEVEADGMEDEMGGGAVTSTVTSEPLVSEDPIDYTEVDNIINDSKTPVDKVEVSNTKTAPVNSNPTPKANTSNTSSKSNKYLVLAGSYLMEANAKEMVKKLKKLGYNDAEVVVFDMSQYYSVSAGRYASLSSAQQQSSSLKRKGIDNYVHTKS